VARGAWKGTAVLTDSGAGAAEAEGRRDTMSVGSGSIRRLSTCTTAAGREEGSGEGETGVGAWEGQG
jgi:hypothetical protein